MLLPQNSALTGYKEIKMHKTLTAAMEETVLQEVHHDLQGLPRYYDPQIIEIFLGFFMNGGGWNNSLSSTIDEINRVWREE